MSVRFDNELLDCQEFKRNSRNQSEKRRRDAFNILVKELEFMVAGRDKKLDKSNVLKKTIHFLHTHNREQANCHSTNNDFSGLRPPFLTCEEYIHLIMEANGAFVMAFSLSGQILFCGDQVSKLFGCTEQFMLKNSVFNFLNAQDAARMKHFLHITSQTNEEYQSISVSLKQPNQSVFRSVEFVGKFKSIAISLSHQHDVAKQNVGTCTTGILSGSGDVVCFVCLVRFLDISSMQSCISAIPSAQSSSSTDNVQFMTRQNEKWQFVFVDHRTQSVLGYSSLDLLGIDAYELVHCEDLEKHMTEHFELQRVGSQVSSRYRLKTKGNLWVWVQSRSQIVYSGKAATTVRFVQSVHTIVDDPTVSQATDGITAPMVVSVKAVTPTNSLETNRSFLSKAVKFHTASSTPGSSGVSIKTEPLPTSALPLGSSRATTSTTSLTHHVNIPNVLIEHCPISITPVGMPSGIREEPRSNLEYLLRRERPVNDQNKAGSSSTSNLSPSEQSARFELLRRQSDLERELNLWESQLKVLKAQVFGSQLIGINQNEQLAAALMMSVSLPTFTTTESDMTSSCGTSMMGYVPKND